MTDGGTKETHVGPQCGDHRMIDITATAINTGPTGEITKTGDGTIPTIEMTVGIGGTTEEATREIAIAGEKDGGDDNITKKNLFKRKIVYKKSSRPIGTTRRCSIG